MKLNKATNKIDTKKKALKLIYDPVCLLRLLYSKYGDIEEDYNCLQINQLIYETSSHYAIIFKEFEYLQNYDEYLKRWYTNRESVNRMPKINDYYKNYHKFFCKPNFSDFIVANIMQNYGDEKAELYYKDNFGVSNSEKEEDVSRKNNSNSFSSLDNITNNKTIFEESGYVPDILGINEPAYGDYINFDTDIHGNILGWKEKNMKQKIIDYLKEKLLSENGED